jgi:hypothetical protein
MLSHYLAARCGAFGARRSPRRIHRIPLTPLPFVPSLAIALAIAWGSVGSQALRAARVSPATVLRSG